MERNFKVKVAYLFEEMHKKALEKKVAENISFVSDFDESVDSNDKQSIVNSYKTCNKMITELLQNAYDANSKNLAVINKVDEEEIESEKNLCIYNIFANDGRPFTDKDLKSIASLPGKSSKKGDSKTCGWYGYGASYRFFQPTLTFAYNAVENCCTVIYTSEKNLRMKNQEDYLPIVVEKINGSFCELVGMDENEFGFTPNVVFVMKNNTYMDPDYIKVNNNFKEHALNSVACGLGTLDTEKLQTYLKVRVDLFGIPCSYSHEDAFQNSKKYSTQKLDFTCFARTYDEEKLQDFLDKHNIRINYSCLSGTEELETLNNILKGENYTVRYKIYRKECKDIPEGKERYIVILVGDKYMFSGSSLISLTTTKDGKRTLKREVYCDRHRIHNGLHCAYKGRVCEFSRNENKNLFSSHMSGLGIKPEDYICIFVNDDCRRENINRTSFYDETPEQVAFLKQAIEEAREHIKRDFMDLIEFFRIPAHDRVEYLEKTQKNYKKLIRKTSFDASRMVPVTDTSFCANAMLSVGDTHEDYIKNLFHTFYQSNDLVIKERFALPLLSMGDKSVNIDYLGIDFAKAIVDYSDEEFAEMQGNKEDFENYMRILTEQYPATIEFESTLSHFFEHAHSIPGLTHIVTGDINGIKLNEEFKLKNRNYTALLEKNKGRKAKARYTLSISSNGEIHKIDVLCLKERVKDLVKDMVSENA